MPRKQPCVSLSALRYEPAAPELQECSVTPRLGDREIREAVGALAPALREVIERRFGFANGQHESLAVIGNHLGLSRQAVRLRERKALAELRARFNAWQLATRA